MLRTRSAIGHVADLARYFPVVAITGPRQAGKTTLARLTFPQKPYVSLENPDVRWTVTSDPRGFLNRYSGGAIIDEVQRVPDVFSYLQQLVDENPSPGRWVLTGSRQFGLRSGITQSLAGRAGLLHLLPFATHEWFAESLPALDELLWTGLYPPLLDRSIPPGIFMPQYVATYVERDVRDILELRDVGVFSRFIRLCAGRVGQLLNLTSLGNDVSVSHHTVRAWLDVLEASYLVFRLPPWHANVAKRLVKSPKLYFYDTGLLCWLLGISSAEQLLVHAQRGAIFENWVAVEVLKSMHNQGKPPQLYFFRDHTGNEVDLLISSGDKLHAIEIKSGETLNSSYFEGLHVFERLVKTACASQHVVYAGTDEPRHRNIQVHGWRGLVQKPFAHLTATL